VDLLALLNVALETTLEADPARIGVFGRSRGGAVALLAAERDSRIRCAVSWAAPADWVRSMAPEGWTQREAAEDAFRRDAKLGEAGGQFLYNFLRFSREGKESLAAVRTRLIASSPLYFAESLPPAQLHYGVEDAIVPERNGRAIESRLRRWPEGARRVELRYHADAGHDQDLFEAPRRSREFLLERLLAVRPETPGP
jgi:dipeptidyl aminopeptidase/acylaminoacyl peptidase